LKTVRPRTPTIITGMIVTHMPAASHTAPVLVTTVVKN
jgi:ABC-type phosphate transport system permease subunit